jgi:hypothetical protein
MINRNGSESERRVCHVIVIDSIIARKRILYMKDQQTSRDNYKRWYIWCKLTQRLKSSGKLSGWLY